VEKILRQEFKKIKLFVSTWRSAARATKLIPILLAGSLLCISLLNYSRLEAETRDLELLLRKLSNQDSSQKRQAIRTLGRLGNPEGIQPLADLFHNPAEKTSIRRQIIIALGQINHASSVTVLVSFLDDKNANIRNLVVKTLGEMQRPASIEPLLLRLKDSDWHIRRQTVESLSQFANETSKADTIFSALILMLKDSSVEVRRQTVMATRRFQNRKMTLALVQLIAQEDNDQVKALICETLGQSQNLDSDTTPIVVQALIPCLYQAAKPVRSQAVKSLGLIRHPNAVSPLIDVVKETGEEANIRGMAAVALGQIGDLQAVPYLIPLLDHPDPIICSNVARALGQIGDRSAVKPMITTLKQMQTREPLQKLVVSILIEGLGKMGEEAVSPLLELLNKSSLPDPVPSQIVNILGQIGDRRAVRSLIQRLDDASGRMRYEAALALRSIGDPVAIPPLVDHLEDVQPNVVFAVALALAGLGDSHALHHLTSVLKTGRAEQRKQAVKALGALGDRQATLNLVAALNDNDQAVRQLAATSLGQIGDARAKTALFSALNDQSPSVRLQSALALAQLGDARMIDPLLVALRDSDARVRMLAANALGRFSNEKSVIKALQKALQDVDWKVRGVAAFTLGQIADVETIVSLEASELKETNPHVQNTIMSSLSHTKARNFQFLGLTGQEGLILAEEACALQPDNVLFQATLGWILYRQKRYPQAIETLEKTTDLESDLAGAYYYLGLSCLGLNQTLPGLNNLKTAFRLDRAYLQRAKTEPLTRGIRDQLNLSAIEPVRGN